MMRLPLWLLIIPLSLQAEEADLEPIGDLEQGIIERLDSVRQRPGYDAVTSDQPPPFELLDGVGFEPPSEPVTSLPAEEPRIKKSTADERSAERAKVGEPEGEGDTIDDAGRPGSAGEGAKERRVARPRPSRRSTPTPTESSEEDQATIVVPVNGDNEVETMVILPDSFETLSDDLPARSGVSPADEDSPVLVPEQTIIIQGVDEVGKLERAFDNARDRSDGTGPR